MSIGDIFLNSRNGRKAIGALVVGVAAATINACAEEENLPSENVGVVTKKVSGLKKTAQRAPDQTPTSSPAAPSSRHNKPAAVEATAVARASDSHSRKPTQTKSGATTSGTVTPEVTATALTQRASKLKMGLSRREVVTRLGKPTWVILPADTGDFALDEGIGLSLQWKNSPCVPIEVMFDKRTRVTGWGEGRMCGVGEIANPSDKFLCTKKARRKHCR